jgi:hypothetical protein
VPEQNIVEEYTPFSHTDYQSIVRKIGDFGRNGDAAVLSTIAFDSNIPFYREFASQGMRPSQIPIMAFSIAEDELRVIGSDGLGPMAGHLAAWNYFQSIDTPDNRAFVQNFKNRFGQARVTDDPIEAAYSGVYAWKAAVEKAGSFEVNRVREALMGLKFNSPAGPKGIQQNHHTAKPFFVGRIRPDGQFDIIYKSADLIEPESFSRYIRELTQRPPTTLNANENAAVMNLRTINTAEVVQLNNNEKGFGDIPALIRAELLDPRFAATLSGYTYSIAVTEAGSGYIATALPASPTSGRFGFFSGPDGVIRYLFDPVGNAGTPVQ